MDEKDQTLSFEKSLVSLVQFNTVEKLITLVLVEINNEQII